MKKSNILNPSGPDQLQECSVYNSTMDKMLIPNVMMAIKEVDKQLGFQFWPELLTGDAILFFFDKEDIRTMHMHNVAFPLLMVWIDANRKILNMFVAQPSDSQLYSSKIPSQYCLECHPALLSRLQLGDQLKFLKKK